MSGQVGDPDGDTGRLDHPDKKHPRLGAETR